MSEVKKLSLAETVTNAEVQQVEIDKVTVREGWGCRSEDDKDKTVAGLLESVKASGVLNALIVNDRLEVIAGLRRLQAAKTAGLKKIPVKVIKTDSDDAEYLLNLDENLEQKTLSNADRHAALSKRKALYERLFPETRAGAAGGHAKAKATKAATNEDSSSAARASHTAVASAQEGVTARTIQKRQKRKTAASPAVWKAFEAEKIKTSQVDELIKLTNHVDQDEVLAEVEKCKADLIQTQSLVEARKAKNSGRPVKMVKESGKNIEFSIWIKEATTAANGLATKLATYVTERLHTIETPADEVAAFKDALLTVSRRLAAREQIISIPAITTAATITSGAIPSGHAGLTHGRGIQQ